MDFENTRLIGFMYDDDDTIKKKYEYLIEKLGAEKVSFADRMAFGKETDGGLPRAVTIKCNYDVFKEIEFQLDLVEAYI